MLFGKNHFTKIYSELLFYQFWFPYKTGSIDHFKGYRWLLRAFQMYRKISKYIPNYSEKKIYFIWSN